MPPEPLRPLFLLCNWCDSSRVSLAATMVTSLPATSLVPVSLTTLLPMTPMSRPASMAMVPPPRLLAVAVRVSMRSVRVWLLLDKKPLVVPP